MFERDIYAISHYAMRYYYVEVDARICRRAFRC